MIKGIVWGAVTETGLVRTKNEDCLCVNPSIGLFAVADGMGGHRAGEIASRLALDVLERELIQRIARGEGLDDAVAKAVQEANHRVWLQAQADPGCEGMGTTLSACVLQHGRMVLAHVGDSRIYRLRDGAIRQLTEDHSLVHELAKQGRLESDNPQSSPLRNVLTRALGTQGRLETDLRGRSLAVGDRLVLCTDGLTNLVNDGEILTVVGKEADPSVAARKLAEIAIARGGTDNITLIVVVIKDDR